MLREWWCGGGRRNIAGWRHIGVQGTGCDTVETNHCVTQVHLAWRQSVQQAASQPGMPNIRGLD